MDALTTINNQLKQIGYTLSPFKDADEASLYAIFRHVVDTGSQFPYECNSLEEFHKRFFGQDSQVYVCKTLDGDVVGGFYLRANYPGRSSHIANAAYMIDEAHRGKGVGTLVINASMILAKELGYHALQFNMVFSSNTGAVHLYKKLGFEIVGTIPRGVRNRDGSYQEGHIMYIQLKDLDT